MPWRYCSPWWSGRGGETGVSEVQLLEGEAVWQAAEQGGWSYGLAEAAMRAGAGKDVGKLQDFVELVDGKQPPVHAILIKYHDGLRATVLRIGNSATCWNFACRLAGKPELLATVLRWSLENRNLFKVLSYAIQTHIREKRASVSARTHLLDHRYSGSRDGFSIREA